MLPLQFILLPHTHDYFDFCVLNDKTEKNSKLWHIHLYMSFFFRNFVAKLTTMTKDELILRLKDIEWDDFEVKEAQHELPDNAW